MLTGVKQVATQETHLNKLWVSLALPMDRTKNDTEMSLSNQHRLFDNQKPEGRENILCEEDEAEVWWVSKAWLCILLVS